MKKLVCLLAVAFAMSLMAFAQQDNSMSKDNNMSQAQSDSGARLR